MEDEDILDDIRGKGDRNFVTSLARGLDVLRAFRPHETTLTNQEIAARTRLPKPTVSRFTHTLCQLGYLVYSERTGTYRLGAGVLSLGFGVLSGMEIADRAGDEMRALCEGPNPHLTAALGENHGTAVVCTAVRRSREAVSLTLNVGARLPLFHSAIGRAILVAMPEDEREGLLAQALAERPGEKARIRESLERGLADYREHGLCTSFGDWRGEVNGIAVPVPSLNGDRIYGLNIGGPAFLVSPEELMERYARPLREAAQRLSRGGAGAD